MDNTKLVPHPPDKIPVDTLKALIRSAIHSANKKSSREILSIPIEASEDEICDICLKKGKELFKYFQKYCGDPASTAHQIYQKHYRDVGLELFRNRTLQKERMNSGWRYQFLVFECANHSKRFLNVLDIGMSEADFNAVIEFADKRESALNLYVSVKNRVNTMGGQDWPKAIRALEDVAKNDKNKKGPYCCVFGIAMDRGMRYIKTVQITKIAHSVNTEIWLSDFFWPFFSNYTYEEIMNYVLEVLIESQQKNDLPTQIDVPPNLLESFGDRCRNADLVNADGIFHDPYRLVRFFVTNK